VAKVQGGSASEDAQVRKRERGERANLPHPKIAAMFEIFKMESKIILLPILTITKPAGAGVSTDGSALP
jgi:hypothetical protein